MHTENGIELADFSCPACEWEQYEEIHVPGRDPYKENMGMYRCAACGYGFINPARYAKTRKQLLS